MKHNLKLQVLMISVLIFIGNIMYGQRTSVYDRTYDLWLYNFSESREKICKTSFKRTKVDSLINLQDVEYLSIGVEVKDTVNTFTLIAHKSNGDSIAKIVGDYPCPKDCIPPEPTVQPKHSSPAKGHNKIEVVHIRDIMKLGSHVNLITIRKGLKWEGGSDYKLSHFIYGAMKNLDTNTGPVEYTSSSDPVFICN